MTGDTAISGDGHISSLLSIYNTGTAGTGIVDDITSGNIRVDKNGWYYVIFQTTSKTSSGADVWYPKIYTYNGTSQSSLAYGHVYNDTGLNSTQTISVLVDISDASTIKLRMGYENASNITLFGTGQAVTAMHILRIGDT